MPCTDFRLKWNNTDLIDIIAAKQEHDEPLSSYTERLLEAETARSYGITFDAAWYGLSLRSREVMVAARLGKQWLDMLQEEEMSRRVAQQQRIIK